MDIKDSYLHGTVGVVKSISVAADKLSYKLADVAGTTKTVTMPTATQSANGLLSKEDKKKLDNMIATKVANDLILKIDSGTTEGTSLYTYNGSAAKTLDIKSGTGIAFSKTAGALQIFNSGVRSIATGTTNGTISVNTNGTSADVAVKGLDSAAYLNKNLLANYTKGTNYIAFNLYDSSLRSVGLGNGYIEYYDNGDWYNSKWGWVEAINGFKGSLTGNAATATKLQTKRKLWGLDFDGTADVSGAMTGVGTINGIFNINKAASGAAVFNVVESSADINYIHLYVSSTNTTAAKSRPLVLQNDYGNVGIGVIAPTQKLEVNGNVKATSFIGNLDGTYVNKLTGYSKAISASALAATDTLNTALGKLEYKADTAYDWIISVTTEDTDKYINKWLEILDFLNKVNDTDGADITDEFVTRKTALTITGLKTFQSDSSTTGVSLILKNNGWAGGMSTAMDFYNGRSYAVPNSRIATLMSGDGKAGGTLIFYTQTKHASTNPNPNDLTERLRIDDNGLTKITGSLTVISNVTGAKFIKSGGTSSQFLKADGSVDSNTYLTSHQSLANYVTLNTALTISGVKTFSTLLKFTVAQGTSPFTVTSNTKVGNLNADFLDDYHVTSLVRKSEMASNSSFNANNMTTDLVIYTSKGDVGSNASVWDNFGASKPAGGFSLFHIKEGGYARQLLGVYNDRHLYTRSQYYSNGTVWSSWSTIALTSDIPKVTDYYWANVKISSTSSTTTTPTFGLTTASYYVATLNMSISTGGLSTDLTAANRGGLFANGVIFTSPGTKNDIGFIRILGTGESDTVLEIGTGDDGAYTTSEAIVARLYRANTIAKEAWLLDTVGNTKLPGQLILGRVTRAFTSYPETSTYKMGLDIGDIHFRGALDNKGNSITWSWGYDTLADAGIYVKHHGDYGSKIYFATTNSWANGPMAAMEIDLHGNITALRSKFIGTLQGSASRLTSITIISSKAFSLSNASWTDTGYTFASLATGTYAIQVTCGNLVASGIMSVYKNIDDTAGDEIPLHVYHDSTQPWRPYLRTSGKKLLISSNDASATSRTVTIKIALIL